MASLSPVNLRYEPQGAARALLESSAGEVLLSGPAGTGKSVACLYKLHLLASKVPGFRGLIARKTRASLTESGLVTFETHVLPPHHPARAGPSRMARRSYHYPNGAEIVVGGLDKASKIMSTEFDAAYVQEAIELAEGDWESLTTRLRNGRLSYQQLLADTNPDAPRHWLRQRCNSGATLMLHSRHEDNPTLWDLARQRWTEGGVKYIGKLDALTGPRRQRLRFGRWVQAEGVVYEGWEPALHLLDRFDIPYDWPRFLSIDFGFSNPFVCQWWAQDDDGRLYRYREIYHTGRLVEDHARQIKSLSVEDPPISIVICDTDAEDRATLERHLGLMTSAAVKSVSPGIQAVAGRLKAAGDKLPRLYLLRDSLVERDPALVDAKRPTCTEEEIDGYVWDVRQGKPPKDAPVKANDHGCDALRYACYTLDSERVDDDPGPTVLKS